MLPCITKLHTLMGILKLGALYNPAEKKHLPILVHFNKAHL